MKIRILLQLSNNHHYYDKVNNIEDDNLLKKGLIFEMHDRWKAQRTLLGGLFEFQQLRNRLPMIQIYLQAIDQFDCQKNILEQLQHITGEVVIKSFFGTSFEGLKINGKDIQITIAELLNDMGELRFQSKYVYVKRLILGIIKKLIRIIIPRLGTFFQQKLRKESRIESSKLNLKQKIQLEISQQKYNKNLITVKKTNNSLTFQIFFFKII